MGMSSRWYARPDSWLPLHQTIIGNCSFPGLKRFNWMTYILHHCRWNSRLTASIAVEGDRKRIRGSRSATFSHSLHETPSNLARRLIPAMDARRWLDANAEIVSACSISSFKATACDNGLMKDLLGAAETTCIVLQILVTPVHSYHCLSLAPWHTLLPTCLCDPIGNHFIAGIHSYG
jgi:hypothetical protein